MIPRAIRAVVVAILVLLVTATGATAVLVLLAKRDPAPAGRRKIRVLARLDEFTLGAGRTTRNTIPAFLSGRGMLGILQGESTHDKSAAAIKPLSESELAKGVCSPNVAVLIRYLYPASYENWPDSKLEKTVLAKHPEYRGKLCILPVWVEATPHQIVKYETVPQTAAPAH